MKTSCLLFATGLLVSSLQADPLGVNDAAANKILSDNLPLINANVATLLDKADQQLKAVQQASGDTSKIKDAIQDVDKKMDSLLAVLGDPSKVKNDDAVKALKDDLKSSSSALQHFQNVNGTLDGMGVDKNTLINNLYNENGGGLFTPITSQYKDDKGNNVNRGTAPGANVPGTDYTLEAGQNQAIKDYFRVRDIALTRRDALQGVLNDALDQLNTAQDFATVAKITAVIQALQSQLQACSDDINNSYNDTAVRGLQAYVLSSVKTKADAEPRMAAQGSKLQSAIDAAKTPPKPSNNGAGTVDYSSSSDQSTYLPWVKFSSK
jgi:hypothetical protein